MSVSRNTVSRTGWRRLRLRPPWPGGAEPGQTL